LHASLEGASILVEQLALADPLAGTVLPDGTRLSEENWKVEFEEWQRKQEEPAEAEQDNDDTKQDDE
jgi:hypothetical protein